MNTADKIKIKIAQKVFDLAQTSVGEIDDGLTSEQATVALCRRMAAEGCVLLRNNDNTLPILEDEKIAVFGRCQNDYFYVGYGSGGDVHAPYKVSPMEAFKRAGVKYNKKLAEKYEFWCKVNKPDDGAWGMWPTNYEEMDIDEATVAAVRKFTDKAIVIIGRSAGEDRESLMEPGSWYLTQEEEKLLSLVTSQYEKTCVVLNVGNIIDMNWAFEYNISAILYAWQGGQESGNGLCDVLTGKINPSGHLTDTIAPIEAYPSTDGFGDKKEPVYKEDIYVGYRYFETFDKDSVWFPFGFGLSYTTFSYSGQILSAEENKIKIRICVKNTGKVAGKAVPQLYIKAPDGALGKPDRELVYFDKTKLLEPGKKTQTTVEIDLSDFASYDDTGVTGHMNSYILEKGSYEFFVGGDVRSAKSIGCSDVEEKIVRKTLEVLPPNKDFQRLEKKFGRITYNRVPAGTRNLRERALRNVHIPMQKHKDDSVSLSDVKSGKITMDYFISCLSTDELECLTRGSLDAMNSKYGPEGNTGCFGGTCDSLQDKGVPAICTDDGPSGVRLQAHSTLYPIGAAVASTFDRQLTEETFFTLGSEVVERNSKVLLAPGMNIHRNPLCGRNFEYFSEDPYLTAQIGIAYVKGVQEAGAVATPKHVCCNNQETARNTSSSLVSQRALREIYLKAFADCIREADPGCMMTSYNKINGIYSYYNYDLNTELLRNEFGFKGVIMTDWWTKDGKIKEFPELRNHAIRVRAGNNVFMPGATVTGPYKNKPDGSIADGLKADNGLSLGELQENARILLEFCLKYMD